MLNQEEVKTEKLFIFFFFPENRKNRCLVEEDCLGILVVHLLDVPEDVLLGDDAEESTVVCDLKRRILIC